jgi:phosphoribosylformylglycinamidine synthase
LAEFCELYGVPCISGKDSMKNDSTRGGRKISIPPTVLFSVIARMADISRAVTLDAKAAGDLVYVLGATAAELGGSEYFHLLGHVGNAVPQLDPKAALKLYAAVGRITQAKLARSLHTPALGGLGVAFAKVAIGGRLGLDVDLDAVPVRGGKLAPLELLFSESNSRFVMTVAPGNAAKVEKLLGKLPFARVGKVVAAPTLQLRSSQLAAPLNLPVAKLADAYQRTLAGI